MCLISIENPKVLEIEPLPYYHLTTECTSIFITYLNYEAQSKDNMSVKQKE